MSSRMLGATLALLNRLLGTTFTTAPGETGSGAIVRQTSPTLVTPALGVATATSVALGGATIGAHALAITGTELISGQLTSTMATGTAPFVVASTTNVANLNASSLGGATMAAPGAIGGGTPASGAFTTLSATTSITSAVVGGYQLGGVVAVQQYASSYLGLYDAAGVVCGALNAGNNFYYSGTHSLQSSGGGTTYLTVGAAGVTQPLDRGLLFTNQTSGAAAQVGTLTNAPTAGNPGFWLKVKIGGVDYTIPCWAG